MFFIPFPSLNNPHYTSPLQHLFSGKLVLPTPSGQAAPSMADKVTGKQPPVNPHHAQAVGNIKVSLNGGEYTTYTLTDGTFHFHNVPAGIYYLDVHAIHLHYPSAKIKVVLDGSVARRKEETPITPEGSAMTADGTGYISVVEFKYPGATRLPASYPIVLQAIAPLAYFQPVQKLSILGILLGNPMMVIMLVLGGGMVLMLQNIDPETMKEIQAQQKAQGQEDPMKQIQKMMNGGGLGGMFGGAAGKDDDDDE